MARSRFWSVAFAFVVVMISRRCPALRDAFTLINRPGDAYQYDKARPPYGDVAQGGHATIATARSLA